MFKRQSANQPAHNANLISVGRVAGVHGIKGEIKILLYGNCEKKKWKTLCISKGDSQRQYTIKGLRPHKRVLLISLFGCDTRDNAMKLVGSEVLIDKTQLPELQDEEYYCFELIGMEVFTEDKIFIGTVKDIFSTGSNDVYVVKGKFGEVLVPAIEDVVIKIDVPKKKMTIRILEGLMPENEI